MGKDPFSVRAGWGCLSLSLLLVYILFFFLAVPHGLWDLSSPTRD